MAVVGKLSSIEDALLYRLSLLVLSPVVPVAWPNVAYSPVVGTAYLRPSFQPNRTDNAAVGTNAPRRHRGIFTIGVHGTLATGVKDSETADSLVEHFLNQIIDRNNVRVRVGSIDGGSSIPWRTAAIREDAWNIIPVTVPWWCDTF